MSTWITKSEHTNDQEILCSYLYIFVRKDLPSKEQITVQACHAAIEASRHFLTKETFHPSLVVLQVDNEEDLEEVTLYLREHGIGCKEFYESWYNDSLTAVGTEIITGEKRRILRNYKLLDLKDWG